MKTAQDALEQLKQGNQRFIEDRRDGVIDNARLTEIASGQHPFAVILGCADSRVPAELIFDQGLGDLFVIRVAGNIAAPSQIGSVEYAAAELGTRLVVVLGHTSCGAVQATIDTIDDPSQLPSPHLQDLVARIAPAIRGVVAEGADDRTSLVAAAVHANIHATVAELREQSDILQNLERDEGLQIVPAEYDLNNGEVRFL